ncbi:hypothetical protein P3S67_022386 [Capsicum chacoense]
MVNSGIHKCTKKSTIPATAEKIISEDGNANPKDVKKSSPINTRTSSSKVQRDHVSHTHLSAVHEEVDIKKNHPSAYDHDKYIPLVDKVIETTMPKATKIDGYTIAKDFLPMHDISKSPEGFSNHLFTGVMTFVMGVVTMVQMTRNMPRKLTDSTLLSGSLKGVDMVKPQAQE